MRIIGMLVFLTACGNEPIKFEDSGTVSNADSGSENGGTSNGENGGDSGGDSGTTGQDSGTTPTDPVTDFSTWNGSRTFLYDYSEYNSDWYCEDTVAETGSALVAGETAYDLLQAACGVCEWFYMVAPESDTACDWIELGTTYRAVVLGDSSAAVYFYRESDGQMELYAQDTSASFDGSNMAYDYETQAYYYYIPIDVSVTGAVTFPVQ